MVGKSDLHKVKSASAWLSLPLLRGGASSLLLTAIMGSFSIASPCPVRPARPRRWLRFRHVFGLVFGRGFWSSFWSRSWSRLWSRLWSRFHGDLGLRALWHNIQVLASRAITFEKRLVSRYLAYAGTLRIFLSSNFRISWQLFCRFHPRTACSGPGTVQYRKQ